MLALTGEGIMGKGPARPVINRAPWVVAKRIKRRCPHCGGRFEPRKPTIRFCSDACGGRYFGPFRMRPCPDDFEQVFVQVRRDLLEEWYGAHRRTITRWLEQCGKERLLKARRDFVRARYEAERDRRCLDMRMRAALRDRSANVAAVLTGEGEDGVGSERP